MFQRSSLLPFLLLLSLGAACGEVETSAEVDAATESNPDANLIDAGTIDAEPVAAIDLLCGEGSPILAFMNRRVECSPSEMFYRLSDNEYMRGESVKAFCRAFYEDFVDSGDILVNEDAFEECANYLENRPCDLIELNSISATPCGKIIDGQVPLEGDCEFNAACSGLAACDKGSDGCGKCKAQSLEGGACVFDRDCTTNYCKEGQCQPKAGLNQSCESGSDCVGRLFCIGDKCQSVAPKVGDFCERSMDCDLQGGNGASGYNGLYCHLMENGGECRQFPKVGDSCISEDDISSYDFDLCNFYNYEWCDPNTNTCKAAIVAGENGSCSAFYTSELGPARVCPDGYRCPMPITLDDDITQCIPIARPGESCEAYDGPAPFFQISTCEGDLLCSNAGFCEVYPPIQCDED